MSQIDLMLLKFIEHHSLFEFIEVYKVYLSNDKRNENSSENLGGKTFLHFAVEHNST
jgi:hypothetical protein